MHIIITGIVLLLILFLIRIFISRRKDLLTELFYKALKNENNGYYEEAIHSYETALSEVKKTKSNRSFRLRIIEKIKILQTVIQYQNNTFISDKK